uniref:G-protein coupled receptors family 1 profile domain-containing protein n=1 Tax=Globodera rostochiensis TaxID=31243 RepID=A0A914HTJ0_GLORO
MRKSSMNMLLLNLALSDLCVLSVNSLYLSPKLFEHYGIKFKFSTIYCCFHTFTTGVCGLVSILTYMLICVERYIVIVCPLHASFWLPYLDLAGANEVKYGCFIEFLPFHWVSEFVLVHVLTKIK